MCRISNFILENFFNDTATTEIYTLSLHDALPISLLNAASIAGLFLTTEAVVAEKPEPTPAPAGDPSGGMGGMDF